MRRLLLFVLAVGALSSASCTRVAGTYRVSWNEAGSASLLRDAEGATRVNNFNNTFTDETAVIATKGDRVTITVRGCTLEGNNPHGGNLMIHRGTCPVVVPKVGTFKAEVFGSLQVIDGRLSGGLHGSFSNQLGGWNGSYQIMVSAK
jgi:hypothetical protein